MAFTRLLGSGGQYKTTVKQKLDSDSADATDEGNRSPKSTNFPATTCPTVFAGMGVKPGPTMKGWLRTGNNMAEEKLT